MTAPKTERNIEMCNMWERGNTQKAIAEHFGIHSTNVRDHLLKVFVNEVVGHEWLEVGPDDWGWVNQYRLSRERK